MERFPGSKIVEEAQEALAAERGVSLIVNGVSELVPVQVVDVDGPFARCHQGNSYWLIRLDALVGYKSFVKTKPYNIDAI